jgi:hypothetical protein
VATEAQKKASSRFSEPRTARGATAPRSCRRVEAEKVGKPLSFTATAVVATKNTAKTTSWRYGLTPAQSHALVTELLTAGSLRLARGEHPGAFLKLSRHFEFANSPSSS